MTDNGIRRYDISTFLAHRAIEAAAIGPPKLPQHVALPGAKLAVEHDRLLAYQDAGHDEQSIVDRTNARWQEAHSAQLAAHEEWVSGPYRDAIVEMSRRKMEAAAEDMRRQAMLDEILAEREG